MQKLTLVVMAAGLGSRYGGLKQIEPVDSQGQILIDYAIYDAVRAGFENVVCIIKPELEAEFEEVIGKRIAPRVRLHYAHQRLDVLPEGFQVPEGRVKPWGTAHAVLCASRQIRGPFAVINADDFYGRSAFEAIYAFLAQPRGVAEHAMVGYRIENTLTEHGTVARGVCRVDGCDRLLEIVERLTIEPRPNGAAFTEDGEHFTALPEGTTVSMNLWGFQESMIDAIRARLGAFLRENLPINPLKCEYFLPYVVNSLLLAREASVTVLPTHEKWHGVTYREDMARVRDALAGMRAAGVYPERLWDA